MTEGNLDLGEAGRGGRINYNFPRCLSNPYSSFQLFAIIVFGCVSSQGWSSNTTGREVCVMNESAAACHFATFVGVVGFVAAIGFLVGEW